MDEVTCVFPGLFIGSAAGAAKPSIVANNFKAVLNVDHYLQKEEELLLPSQCLYYKAGLVIGTPQVLFGRVQPTNKWFDITLVVMLVNQLMTHYYGQNILIYDEDGDVIAPQIAALWIQYYKTRKLMPSIPQKYWRVMRRKRHSIIKMPTFIVLDRNLKAPAEIIEA